MSTESLLLAMQAPSGVPRSTIFEQVSDPILPPPTVKGMLRHFYEGIYDLSPESHLTRLAKVLLGDTGTGQLRKRYTYAHLSQFVLTSHYGDLDRLYAAIFGLTRFLDERLTVDPYVTSATDAEWEAIDAADAGYRNRVEAFSRAIQWGGTPNGMVIGASAILGTECRVYESYDFIDNDTVYAQANSSAATTYAELEASSYGALNGRTYGSLEGSQPFRGRLGPTRGEFIIRPLRSITDEERYHLTTVLSRLKPAEALLTIDARPAALFTPLDVAHAYASSSYWHVKSRVQPHPAMVTAYDRVDLDHPEIPQEQPRPAFSAYQGEAWSYNADVVSVSAYAELEDDDGTISVVADQNFDRVVTAGSTTNYDPASSLQDPISILQGRVVSDGVLTAPVADRSTS